MRVFASISIRWQSPKRAGHEPPTLPQFSEESAIQKGRAAEDAWNTRDPARVPLDYTLDSLWRNCAEIEASPDPQMGVDSLAREFVESNGGTEHSATRSGAGHG